MAVKKRLQGDALADTVGAITGHAFSNGSLLQLALTHSSRRAEENADNERLEFLGDRVLGLICTEMLFHAHPEATQGELNLRLIALVSGETCARIAEEIGLRDLVLADIPLTSQKGRKTKNVLADALEALVAAVYLDGGMGAAKAFVLRYWEPIAKAGLTITREPKTELQEWLVKLGGKRPAYAISGREGPEHEPVFTVTLEVDGFVPLAGKGRSKQAAEQAAALAFLVREGVRTAEGEG